jgi:phenylacetate-CoA ligase
MAGNLITKTRGTLAILAQLPSQRRTHFLPRERLIALRDDRVRALVRYAAETVPYYGELFRREGIDPYAIKTADDLVSLPVLDRATIQADPERFRSTSAAGRAAVEFRTTGSSGTPLTIYHDRESLLANIAFAERERMVESGLCGRRLRYRIVELSHTAATERRVRAIYGLTSFRPLRPERAVLSIADPPEQVLAEIDRLRPDVIVGYGGYLEFLFRTAWQLGFALRHPPAAVVYGRDTMTDEGRQFIESRFATKVLSRYAAVEAFKIGFFCERRNGFHLHEDLCHVRVIDEKGPSPPGKTGEVVLTNLVNRGTVLVNYRIADLASFASDECSCGRTSRRLARLSGRTDEIVRLQDGTSIHPLQVWDAIARHPEVLRYQVAQVEPDCFELRLLVGDAETEARVGARVGPELVRLFHGAKVDVRRLDPRVANGGRKFTPVVAYRDLTEKE